MLNVILPSEITATPLPIAEAKGPDGTHLVLVIEEDGHVAFKIAEIHGQEFVSATPTTYQRDDARIRGFFPIVGSRGVNTVGIPALNVNDKVSVNHQPDLGSCVVVERCALTDVEYLDGDTMTRVGYYVKIKSRKVKDVLGYHEASLTLVPQTQYEPEAT